VLFLRKSVVRIWIREREVVQLDELARRLGLPSRSRLANIALQFFFELNNDDLPVLGQRRRVKILLDPSIKEKLDELSRLFRIRKAEVTKIALNEFTHRNQATSVQQGREP
jgi:hypothetical protein